MHYQDTSTEILTFCRLIQAIITTYLSRNEVDRSITDMNKTCQYAQYKSTSSKVSFEALTLALLFELKQMVTFYDSASSISIVKNDNSWTVFQSIPLAAYSYYILYKVFLSMTIFLINKKLYWKVYETTLTFISSMKI